MPLPAGWQNLFYDEDTGYDLITGLTPREFAGIIELNDLDPALLLAAAYFYLLAIGEPDQAAEYIAYAERRWPNRPWADVRAFFARHAADTNRQDGDSPRKALASALQDRLPVTFASG